MTGLNLIWVVSVTFPGKGGNLDDPDWSIVEEKLARIVGGAGIVGLEAEDEYGRTRSIRVSADNRAYFITFAFETSDDWVVHTYTNSSVPAPGQSIEILGSIWNTKNICYDDTLVKDLFREFFETGSIVNENIV